MTSMDDHENHIQYSLSLWLAFHDDFKVNVTTGKAWAVVAISTCNPIRYIGHQIPLAVLACW